MANQTNHPWKPMRTLLHPSWLVALIVLALNDHVLKGSGFLPAVLTGKLSDLAGLYVAPAALAALLRVRRRGFFGTHLATGIVFVAIKTSPAASAAFTGALAWLGVPWRNWCDATDLLALPMLVASFVILGRAARARTTSCDGHSRVVARRAALLIALPIILGSGGFTSECDNPNPYRVLALDGGAVFERRDAKIRCLEWTEGCSSATAEVGTTAPPPSGYPCSCLRYALTAGDFLIEFPPSSVGKATKLDDGGTLTITKANLVPTSCAQGDYYADYSGTFEGTIGGHTYRRGVFYALEVK